MTTISRSRSREETAAIERRLRETGAGEPRSEPRDPERHAEALERALAHPCAHHVWRLDRLWQALGRMRASLGDHDGAIDAQRHAIDHGLSGPGPQVVIAHWHLQAGRRRQADRLLGELRERHPDETTLYHRAGLAYLEAEDHSTAMRWLTAGLGLALEQDGEEGAGAVGMADLRRHCLEALGADPDDELTQRAEALGGSGEPPAGGAAVDPPAALGADAERPEPGSRSCGHCGYEPGGASAP